MLKFAGEKPVIFEILLIIASFLLSLVFMLPFLAIIGWPTEPAGAMGRIIAAVIVFLVFIRGFELKKQFSGFILMLPALLFALWNVIYCYITGGEIETPGFAFVLFWVMLIAEAAYAFYLLAGTKSNNN